MHPVFADVAVGTEALAEPLVIAVVAGGLVVGVWIAWFSQRWHPARDEDDFEYAELGDATCPHCQSTLSLPDVAQTGTIGCVHCGHRLPWLYPLTVLAVVAASIGTYMTWGARAVLLPYLWLVPVLVSAAVIDIRTFLIPKRLVHVGFGVGALMLTATALYYDNTSLLRNALIGAVAYFLFLFAANIIYPAGMGYGDVRLSGILGLYLGFIEIRMPLYGLLAACIFGIAFGVIRLSTASTDEEKAFPFGPGLAAGTFVAIFAQSVLVG